MPRATRLASWDETTDGWQHASNEVREELAQWLRLTPDTFRQELAARAQFLQQLVESGADAIPAVRQAVALYRGQRVGRGAWWESKSLLD